MAKQGKRWVGLGTLVARGTARVGIRPCRGCRRRAQALDRYVPKIWKLPAKPTWMR